MGKDKQQVKSQISTVFFYSSKCSFRANTWQRFNKFDRCYGKLK